MMHQSHGFMLSDHFVAMGASVLLIIERWDAERNAAAAKPAAHNAENDAENPGKGALLLCHVSHAILSAKLALNNRGVVWPVERWESTGRLLLDLYNDRLSCWHCLVVAVCHLLLLVEDIFNNTKIIIIIITIKIEFYRY